MIDGYTLCGRHRRYMKYGLERRNAFVRRCSFVRVAPDARMLTMPSCNPMIQFHIIEEDVPCWFEVVGDSEILRLRKGIEAEAWSQT